MVGLAACLESRVKQVVIGKVAVFCFRVVRNRLAFVVFVVGSVHGFAQCWQVVQAENRVAAFLAQFAFFQSGEVVVVFCAAGGLCPAGEAEVVGDKGVTFAVVQEHGGFAALRDGGDGLAAFGIQGEGKRCSGFAFFANVGHHAVFTGRDIIRERRGAAFAVAARVRARAMRVFLLMFFPFVKKVGVAAHLSGFCLFSPPAGAGRLYGGDRSFVLSL